MLSYLLKSRFFLAFLAYLVVVLPFAGSRTFILPVPMGVLVTLTIGASVILSASFGMLFAEHLRVGRERATEMAKKAWTDARNA